VTPPLSHVPRLKITRTDGHTKDAARDKVTGQPRMWTVGAGRGSSRGWVVAVKSADSPTGRTRRRRWSVLSAARAIARGREELAMLNRRGRERLAEIESALVTDDPKLAARFDQFDSGDSTEDVLPRVVLFALVGMLGVLSVATLV